jgi:DNA-binding response OmpR family regulator
MFESIKKIFQKEAKHFLVVDDNIQINEFLCEYLHKFGHHGSYLTDATQVLGWLKSNRCDAVILDLNLGLDDRDGIQVLEEVRKDFSSLPIVIFTGEGYDEARLQAAIKAGASGYVSKSVRPSDMYSALMRALNLPV